MSAKILIVDDEPNIRLMLRTALANYGYAISEAASGREALERIEADAPDLIVLDLNMPEMDGMALLKELKLRPPGQRPRVVVLTAHGSVAVAVAATRLGASDFLEKPVTPVDLRLSIACVLDEPREPVAPVDETEAATLARVRHELAMGDVGNAEAMLMRSPEIAESNPAYFNLLGVVYETEGRRHLAKKCFTKAIESDRHYEPARNNLQRLREIETTGSTGLRISLGNEAHASR